mgnify:CR=1 FL=1
MKDQDIIDLYWKRDEAAISATADTYGKYCHCIAYNILHSNEDADECVNDTWWNAWESIPPQKPNRLSTYLGKLTRRICIDCFRCRNRDKRRGSEYAISLSELSDCVSGGNTTEDAVNVKLLADAIGIYLRLIPEDARTAFLGRYYFLDSLKEVAAYCGMTESKCKSLLHRTRLGLKEYLRKEGFDL